MCAQLAKRLGEQPIEKYAHLKQDAVGMRWETVEREIATFNKRAHARQGTLRHAQARDLPR